MGGSQSQEFMVYTDAGEDLIASCPVCGYAANLEKATSKLEPVVEMEPTGDGKPELVSTPGCAAISDVAEFFKISPASDIKCVAYMALKRGAAGKARYLARSRCVLAWRPPGQRNEIARRNWRQRNCARCRPRSSQQYFNGPAGYLGPVGSEA